MEELIQGTSERRAAIDELLEKHSANWKIDRMPVVDRNLLRVAVFELLQGATPPAIVIDEALEVARRLSGDESVSFVNGVLDAVKRGLQEATPSQ
jgi:N utilization substance protein B